MLKKTSTVYVQAFARPGLEMLLEQILSAVHLVSLGRGSGTIELNEDLDCACNQKLFSLTDISSSHRGMVLFITLFGSVSAHISIPHLSVSELVAMILYSMRRF